MRMPWRWHKQLASVSVLLIIGACSPRETVYVTASVLNMRTGPSTRAKVAGRLLRGHELSLTERQGKWLSVSSVELGAGWVHGDYVGDPVAVRKAYDRDRGTRSAGRRIRKAETRSPDPVAPGSQDPARLNLSVDRLLDGFPEETTIESLAPVNGEERARAILLGGQVAEFWGDDDNLSRAAMVVPVVGESDEAVAASAGLVLTFVQNAVPRWNRDAAWLVQRLRTLTSRDAGKMGFDADGKSVRFDFIKPLGSARVLIHPKA